MRIDFYPICLLLALSFLSGCKTDGQASSGVVNINTNRIDPSQLGAFFKCTSPGGEETIWLQKLVTDGPTPKIWYGNINRVVELDVKSFTSKLRLQYDWAIRASETLPGGDFVPTIHVEYKIETNYKKAADQNGNGVIDTDEQAGATLDLYVQDNQGEWSTRFKDGTCSKI